MLKKLRGLGIGAYFAVRGAAQDLKDDERGLEVVQVVLIVLIGVLLVAALWAVLSGWIGDLWSQITGAGDSITQPTFGS